MRPDDKYHEKQAQVEATKLKQKVEALSPGDRQQIYEKGPRLPSEPARPDLHSGRVHLLVS